MGKLNLRQLEDADRIPYGSPTQFNRGVADFSNNYSTVIEMKSVISIICTIFEHLL